MTHDPDATQRALEHDIEVLEEKALHTAKSFAVRVLPIAAGVLGLLVVAFIAGRRLRARAERKHPR
jgi:multisubunit Na+/H+ antiporter MnhB subunit